MAYATVAELKAALDKTSAAEDTELTLALDGATAFIDRYTGRTFTLSDSETRQFDGSDTGRILVGDLVAVTGVQLAGGTGATLEALVATDYYPGPNIRPLGHPYRWLDLSDAGSYRAWSLGYRTVRVTGTWGWATVPAAIKQVCISLAARWWQATQAGFSDIIAVDALGAPQFSRAVGPYDRAVLNSYRRLVLA